jgi:ankyrin repeat protein
MSAKAEPPSHNLPSMGLCASAEAKPVAESALPSRAAPPEAYSPPTSLHRACKEANGEALEEIMRGLTDEQVIEQARTVDRNNDTALSVAIRAGSAECAQILVGRRAGAAPRPALELLAIEAKSRTGETPLHLCARAAATVGERNAMRIARVLLDVGVVKHAKNTFGSTARDVVPQPMTELQELLFDESRDIRVVRVGSG